jgi:hypothetical protein
MKRDEISYNPVIGLNAQAVIFHACLEAGLLG